MCWAEHEQSSQIGGVPVPQKISIILNDVSTSIQDTEQSIRKSIRNRVFFLHRIFIKVIKLGQPFSQKMGIDRITFSPLIF